MPSLLACVPHLQEVQGHVRRVVDAEADAEHQHDAGHGVDGQPPPGDQRHHVHLTPQRDVVLTPFTYTGY